MKNKLKFSSTQSHCKNEQQQRSSNKVNIKTLFRSELHFIHLYRSVAHHFKVNKCYMYIREKVKAKKNRSKRDNEQSKWKKTICGEH